ncbi:hypothetical protein V3R04_26715, partial [Escherichia coli]
ALIAPLLGPPVGAAWVHVLPWEMMFVLFAVLAAISFFGLQRAMPETATRLGEKLSVKELGRDYRLVLKNLRFVAGALAMQGVGAPLGVVLLVVVLACLLADVAWYLAGRRYGGFLLRNICKFSLSQDRCIRQSQ